MKLSHTTRSVECGGPDLDGDVYALHVVAGCPVRSWVRCHVGLCGPGAIGGAIKDRDRIAELAGDVDAGSVRRDGHRERALKGLAGVGAAGDITGGFVDDAAGGAGLLGQGAVGGALAGLGEAAWRVSSAP